MGCCTNTNERETSDRGAQALYSAAVENRGDSTYLATTKHGSFVMSTGGRGVNPVDTLLASLCACVAHYARDFLRDRNIPADALTVSASATATPDGGRLAEIDARIEVKGATLDDRQRQDLLRAAERCKVHNTLKAGCGIRVTVGGA
jgi:uncharacterized OsmC-like protein